MALRGLVGLWAWWRSPAAMLVWLLRRRIVTARFRREAITCGPLPVRIRQRVFGPRSTPWLLAPPNAEDNLAALEAIALASTTLVGGSSAGPPADRSTRGRLWSWSPCRISPST